MYTNLFILDGQADGVLFAPETFCHKALGKERDGDSTHIIDALVDKMHPRARRYWHVEHCAAWHVLPRSLDAQMSPF